MRPICTNRRCGSRKLRKREPTSTFRRDPELHRLTAAIGGSVQVLVRESSYEARRSALPDRVEIQVRFERRRSWSDGDKLAIVRETPAPGAVAQAVAGRHGISTGLLYTWRKQMLLAAMTGFAAVGIRPEALPAPQVADGSAVPAPAVAPPEVPPVTEAMSPPARPGLIEVEPDRMRLRAGAFCPTIPPDWLPKRHRRLGSGIVRHRLSSHPGPPTRTWRNRPLRALPGSSRLDPGDAGRIQRRMLH